MAIRAGPWANTKLTFPCSGSFPLSEHIVDIKRDVEPPEYVSKQVIKDLSKLFPAGERDVRDVNILNDWPSDLASELDASQMDALRRMLAKRLAIVQGPPVRLYAVLSLWDNPFQVEKHVTGVLAPDTPF